VQRGRAAGGSKRDCSEFRDVMVQAAVRVGPPMIMILCMIIEVGKHDF
jgi:hypothetical protein